MRRRKPAAGSRFARPCHGVGLALLTAWLAGCRGSTPDHEASTIADATDSEAAGPPSEIDAAVDGLVEYAAQRRAALDFGELPPWGRRSGADPSALLARGDHTLGLMRSGRVVRLDAQATVLAEVATLPGATGMAVQGEALVVASEDTGELDVLDATTLARRQRLAVPGLHSIRDVAWGEAEGRLYLADPHRHRIVRTPPPAGPLGEADVEHVDACEGALAVVRTGAWLVYDCMLGHRVVARAVEPTGDLGPPAIIEHDGPIWSIDATTSESGSLWLMAGGVEDHPLDRTDGSFGYIDSFAFVYEVRLAAPGQAPAAQRRHATNVSEHGVVTPKHVRWLQAPTQALVTGYGSDTAVTITWSEGQSEAHSVETHTLVPGITGSTGTVASGVWASPLLDAWIVTAPGQDPRIVPTEDPADDRTPSERLGEALVFTGLMAPQAQSEGKRSRFTCETCHFEGRTDGRTHWTGRRDVHATTKTLRGLLNNRPHFSRALDPTTAGMVHSEFRVANAGTDFDPWFSLTRADAPWLDALGAPPDPLDPVTLRRAVIDFIAAFTPEPNPAVAGLTALSDEQARGADLFAQYCESCHAARLVADDPGSAVPQPQWASLVLHPTGGIVWGSDARAKTGVEPYVHAQGPRNPSLRRLWVKRPLLTNGRAASVDDVLQAVRLGVPEVHGGGDGQPLPSADQQALAAFLDLL